MTYSPRVLLSFLFSLVCFLQSNISAQTFPTLTAEQQHSRSFPTTSACASSQIHERQLLDPAYKKRQAEIEEMLYQNALQQVRNGFIPANRKKEMAQGKALEILTIPLIIHIVHLSSEPNPGDGPSNPTDAQIEAGIAHLNAAFRNVGVYAENGHNPLPAVQSVDVEIEFCLAQRDINGVPTSGILRYANDTYANLNIDQEDPDMQQWVADQDGNVYPGTDYAHVWLVNEICVDSGSPNIPNPCGIAGYAYFPGSHGAVNNGVVNLAYYWGTSENASKIHIHEFGHYLNLYHTFQDGCSNGDCLTEGDRVCDTPPDNRLNFSNCGASDNSCNTDSLDLSENNPFEVDVDDLYENYMDYTSIACQNTYTQNQKERMRAALQGARGSLLTSQACIPVDGPEASLNRILSPDQVVCSNIFTPIVEVQNNGTEAITSLSLQTRLNDQLQPTLDWTGNILIGETQEISFPALEIPGLGGYTLDIEIVSVNGSPDPFVNNNRKIQSFQYHEAITQLPYCEDIEAGLVAPEWIINNPDNEVGFTAINVETCGANGSYVLGLQTWAEFPSQNTTETLLTQSIDLSNIPHQQAQFSFDIAHAITYSNFNTILDVSVSTDCGLNYISLYNKTGSDLATVVVEAEDSVDPEAFYVPTDCNEWRKETILLDQFVGQTILLRIQASTADIIGSPFGYFWGNNLYLDNLCIDGEYRPGDCAEEELEFLDTPIPAGTYDDAFAIFAAVSTADGDTVNLVAGESINLLAGFKVTPGSVFRGSIAPCGPANAARNKSELEDSKSFEIENQPSPALADGLDFQISPNPASGQVNVRYFLPEVPNFARLSILNLQGRVVYDTGLPHSLGSEQLSLSTTQMTNGMYLLRFQVDDQILSKKILIINP